MSKVEEPGERAQIQITAPQRFTPVRLLVCSAYGLLLFLPAIISILAVSLLQLSVLTIAIPLLTLALATFFLPFGFGNGYVAWLAEPLRPAQGDARLVQLAFVPRLRWGLRGMMEDADDIGWLSCTDSALVFRGDSVNLRVPFAQVKSVKPENSGFRGLFLYSRTAVNVEGFEDFTTLRFAERSSRLLPSSRRIAKELFNYVSSKISERNPSR